MIVLGQKNSRSRKRDCSSWMKIPMLTLVRIVLIVILIAVGVGGYRLICALKQPPAEASVGEVARRVEAVILRAEDVPVSLRGYGTVRARNRVSVSAEVGGLIVGIHPRLETGEIIPAGEELFEVDPRTYTVRLEQAKAEIERLNAQVDRIAQQQANDARRLELSGRSRDLAASEFDRVSRLLEEDNVGSRSAVELAERTLTQAEDLVVALENSLAVYPIQLKETEAALTAADVARDGAALDLERTAVRAPFDARLEEVSLELNQVVAPGQILLTIVDDSILEIPVSLDSREMARWFPFGISSESAAAGGETTGWYAALTSDLAVEVYWSENRACAWQGRLVRVERFDADTSTTMVIVEIVAPLDARNGDHEDATPPLAMVDGMFCEVTIPGKIAKDVFRTPAEAVSHEKTVVLARQNRLTTVPVTVVYRSAREVFVRGTLSDGDILVITRLGNPVENTLLEVSLLPDRPSGDRK